jgi:hypothetical protein
MNWEVFFNLGIRALALALRDQFPDLAYEFVRNIHYRVGGLNACLILRQSILLGLLLVMGKYSSHFLFVPIGWKLVFAH